MFWSSIGSQEQELFLPTLAQIDNSSEINPGSIFETLSNWRRQKHTSPLRDEIRSCHQHALLARAYLEAGLAFENEIWIEMAKNLLDWMKSTFLSEDNQVSSLFYPDRSSSNFAFLEDYALWAESLLTFASISELYDHGSMQIWIQEAENLVNQCVEKFKDPVICGFFHPQNQ